MYYLELFLITFMQLKGEVKSLQQKTPERLKGHPKVKLYIDIVKVLKEIENDPTQAQYNLGNTLGTSYRKWKRVKKGLPDRYRLFFFYRSSPVPEITIVWINDEKTLRKEGAKSDCYNVFKKMLDSNKMSSVRYEIQKKAIDFI